MSLSALNNPLLVSSLGVGGFVLLPTLDQAITNGVIPFRYAQIANVIAYGLNVFATSRPGRIDSAAAMQPKKNDDGIKKDEADEMMDKLSTGSAGKTLLAPAGWAFAIWGPIFLGELVFVGSQLFLKESDSKVSSVVKKASGPFIVAQLFHVLWAASFRPKYKGKLMFISASMLGGIATSMNKAHTAYTTSSSSTSLSSYLLYFLPMSLHYGWTTAATLVNLNGALVEQDIFSSSPKAMAHIGHLSAIVATVDGVAITITRSAPVFGAVISWALSAVASGMKSRLAEAKDDPKGDKNQVGRYGATTQKRICEIGALVTALTSIYVAATATRSKA